MKTPEAQRRQLELAEQIEDLLRIPEVHRFAALLCEQRILAQSTSNSYLNEND